LDNITTEKPDHENATARIFINGLSVMCFNRGLKCAQIGFFGGPHFPATMKIIKRDSSTLWETTQQSRITDVKINTDDPNNPNNLGWRYQNGKVDDDDFLHFPSLNGEMFYNTSSLRIKPYPKQHFQTILNIYRGVFYTYKRIKQTNEAIRYNIDTMSHGNHSRIYPRNLGRIGKILGADIFDPTITIQISGTNLPSPPPPLLKADGPYTIKIETLSQDTRVNHFKHLYDIIYIPSRASEYSMEFTESEEKISDVPCQAFPIGDGDLES
jgi:hypothetical protein